MKNVVMYFYDLEPKDIHQTGKTYRFMVGDKTYLFFPSYRSVKEVEQLDSLCMFLSYFSFPLHTIVLNKQGKKLTFYQDENYILLELIGDYQDPISFMDILSFQDTVIETNSYPSLLRNDWYTLWTQKIDYFEYQVNQFGKKHPIIRESFSYFCGLAENAIQYTRLMQDDHLCLSHHRMKRNMKKLEFYNPLNIIVDYKVRDIAEYFKDQFFYGYLPFEEVEYVLEYQLKEKEYISFYTRMLFPSFYFDIYEDILANQKNEKELLPIIHKTEQYEQLLRQIYAYIARKVHFLKPDWL